MKSRSARATAAMWQEGWRLLSAITDTIAKDDPRLPIVTVSISICDECFMTGDWPTFRRALRKLQRAVNTTGGNHNER